MGKSLKDTCELAHLFNWVVHFDDASGFDGYIESVELQVYSSCTNELFVWKVWNPEESWW